MKPSELSSAVKFKLHDIVFIYFLPLVSLLYLIAYKIPFINKTKRLSYLMVSHRYTRRAITESIIKANLPDIVQHSIDMLPEQSDREKKWSENRFIVLKNPVFHDDKIEKGAILIKFTDTFGFFAKNLKCDKLLKYFNVVLEPSWSGYCLPEIHYWNNFKNSKAVVEATEINDYEYLKNLNTNLIPVDFGSGNWVDDRKFFPTENPKKIYDSIFIANYNVIKRPHILFKAINNTNDPKYSAALVFSKWGPNKRSTHNLIDFYNIRNNITLYENLSQTEINGLLNQSKVNVLLSLKEGSNRCIFEGFFSNVPGIVLKENIGVNKSYINEHTGKLISDHELPETLLHFKHHWQQYSPRDWAMKNISPKVTTSRLNDILKNITLKEHGIWTTDIAIKTNAPEAIYYHTDDESKFISHETIKSLFSKSSEHSDEAIENSLRSEITSINKTATA